MCLRLLPDAIQQDIRLVSSSSLGQLQEHKAVSLCGSIEWMQDITTPMKFQLSIKFDILTCAK